MSTKSVLCLSPTRPNAAEIVRRHSPDPTALGEVYAGYRDEARSSFEAPPYGYVDDDAVQDEEHGYDEYDELCDALSWRDGQLAGRFDRSYCSLYSS